MKHLFVKTLFFFMTAFVTVLFLCSNGNVVFAGSINSDESRVIAVASGTFTYDGKIYKAYSSYVNDLYYYMQRDDVDLTSSQADRAINYIYANVSKGISSGYVYEVVEQEENNIELDEVIPEMEKSGELSQYLSDGNDIDSEENSKAAKETAKNASDQEVDKMFGEVNQTHKENDKHSDKIAASETDASIILSDDGIIIKNEDDSYIFNKDSRIIPSVCGTLLVAVSIIAFVLSVITGILLMIFKCFRFTGKNSKKVRKGHHTRKKVRKLSKYIIVVSGSVSFILIFVNIALLIGFFDNNHIVQSIQDSGYFRFAYLKYISEASDSPDNFYSYEDFLLKEQTSIVKLQTSELSSNVSLVPYIRQMQSDIRVPLVFSTILIIINIVLISFIAFFMDAKRYIGISALAISSIIGTFFVLALILIIYLMHIDKNVFIEPDFLYHFIINHLEWINKILGIISAFGAVISMALVGVSRSLQKGKEW